MKIEDAVNICRPLSQEDELRMLPEVDYDFFQEAISNAMPEEADVIMQIYELGDNADYLLGTVVRAQIEKYREEVRDIDIKDNQPLK